MLLDQKIKVKLTLKNKEHYEKHGYIFTKSGDYIFVSPYELTDGSHEVVKYICDFCNKECQNKWFDYIKCRKKDILINKECCSGCIPLKNKQIMKEKQKLGLLKHNENGYWTFRDNRLKELKNFIDTYNHANVYNHPKGKQICSSFSMYEESIAFVLLYDFNLNPSEYLTTISLNFYKEFTNINKVITEFFIKRYNRFPTVDELRIDLGINYEHITKHGGIHELKRKMKYNDENDLIDDSGFKNSSWFEYMVAQFLLQNDISFKREQKPFPKEEGKYRSDFLFISSKNDEIYLELWGYSKNNNYKIVKKHKKALYEKYNLKLIELDYEEIKRKKYSGIQSFLCTFFHEVLNLKLINVNEQCLYPKTLTDEKLLELLMEFSDDLEFVPDPSKLKGTVGYKYYEEVLRRYKYHEFAEKFNKRIRNARNFWTLDKVYSEFTNIIENGYSLSNTSLKKLKRSDLISYIDGIGGVIKSKTNFFYENPKLLTHSDDIKFIRRTSENKFKCEVPMELREKAKQIFKY